MNQSSYTAASQTIPTKCVNTRFIEATARRDIRPLHVQLSPTNACNQQCSWCSCRDRNQDLEMGLDEVSHVADVLKSLGTRAVTLSGGGEPLMHMHLWDLCHELTRRGFALGLTTNGLLIDAAEINKFRIFEWVRVSLSDYRTWDDNLAHVTEMPITDWSISFVVAANQKYDNLLTTLDEAEKIPTISHVRVTTDITDEEIILPIYDKYSKAIWQGRSHYQRGAKQCLVSLLRPVINPDMSVAPCCGIQYQDWLPAKAEGTWTTIDELPEIIRSQKCYDGSRCNKCFYGPYNDLLHAAQSNPKHRLFL